MELIKEIIKNLLIKIETLQWQFLTFLLYITIYFFLRQNVFQIYSLQ